MAALVYWISESTIHVIFFHTESLEIIPRETNELWMRATIITFFLIFGNYVDFFIRKIKKKEQEKVEIYHAMLDSSYHIINIYLNQMQLIKIEAEKCENFDKDLLVTFAAISDEAATLLKRLASVSDLSENNILEAVLPTENFDF